MYKKIFKTFVTESDKLENEIIDWLKENNNGREIDRSAPAIIVKDAKVLVAVTSTAEVYEG